MRLIWKTYSDESIQGKFPVGQWKKIVSAEIKSDADWKDFVSRHDLIVKCYVLYKVADNSSIGFCFLYIEDWTKKIVSFHGGGWSDHFLYYRGIIILMEKIFSSGYKIRSRSSLDNIRSIKLLRRIGFVPYKYDTKQVYLWLTLKRLKQSKFYKRLYP